MDISQTSVPNHPGKPEPDKTNDDTDRSSDTYYYDDATGYEVYEEDKEDDDEAEDGELE